MQDAGDWKTCVCVFGWKTNTSCFHLCPSEPIAFKLLISGAFSIMLVIFAMSWNRTFYVRQFGAVDSEGQ